jgi:hypothetical protein
VECVGRSRKVARKGRWEGVGRCDVLEVRVTYLEVLQGGGGNVLQQEHGRLAEVGNVQNELVEEGQLVRDLVAVVAQRFIAGHLASS